MKLEQQVTSVEISNKIHTLGVTTSSLFFRDSIHSEEYEIERWSSADGYYSPDNVNCYTVAELGKMLPHQVIREKVGFYLVIDNGFSIDKFIGIKVGTPYNSK